MSCSRGLAEVTQLQIKCEGNQADGGAATNRWEAPAQKPFDMGGILPTGHRGSPLRRGAHFRSVGMDRSDWGGSDLSNVVAFAPGLGGRFLDFRSFESRRWDRGS